MEGRYFRDLLTPVTFCRYFLRFATFEGSLLSELYPVQSSSLLHYNKKSKMADNSVNKASKIFTFAGLYPNLISATKGSCGLERERKVWSDNWANSLCAFRKDFKVLPWRRDGPEIYQGNRKLIRR